MIRDLHGLQEITKYGCIPAILALPIDALLFAQKGGYVGIFCDFIALPVRNRYRSRLVQYRNVLDRVISTRTRPPGQQKSNACG